MTNDPGTFTKHLSVFTIIFTFDNYTAIKPPFLATHAHTYIHRRTYAHMDKLINVCMHAHVHVHIMHELAHHTCTHIVSWTNSSCTYIRMCTHCKHVHTHTPMRVRPTHKHTHHAHTYTLRQTYTKTHPPLIPHPHLSHVYCIKLAFALSLVLCL